VIDLSANSLAFEEGLLLGIFIGEGHFGGDSHQPHINLKMHVRHEPLLARFQRMWPGSCLYGPYNHNDRRYFQRMFRCSVLRYRLIPFLAHLPWKSINPRSYGRFTAMLERYNLSVGPKERDEK
jgi:hypothetical protein